MRLFGFTMAGLALLLVAMGTAEASPQQVYDQAMNTAAKGRMSEAIALMQGAAAVLPTTDPWRQRLAAAEWLLSMRRARATASTAALPETSNGWMLLARKFMRKHPAPGASAVWPVGLLAAVLPGAGHAWLGRWRDAATAVGLTWPMILLTFWAARRRMGPVTLFFAIIMLWLWSGTVFSAISLAERGGAESYMGWWQHLWLASGLPGRPW